MGEIDNQVGFAIRMLDIGMRKVLEADMKENGYDEATLMHSWILKYLYVNRDREVYQRDIEKHFGIGRSTVTTIIQLMEKRDLVCREAVEHDARLKKVYLTKKGFAHHELVEKNIQNMNKQAMAGISEEEKKEFLRIAEKIGMNLKKNKACMCMKCSMGMKEEKGEREGKE